ncbi:cobalamin B12-binding domain-containing protein [Sulfitobacter aestuariivivens]|uniref:Cobalamin B12-binding domain-containing protein n=1 Tax=Sulfitobacter aestuariivivens TaxID=2766981 RepID=A0A927D755_9RHOB|nr:cobalamin B12-binding domain-containing protein [Sulfitobacter aestuariivivens]MBD3665039.1 cobalamin B12-binding domain-containing protein [Sulfitobacter aestuariivivens]
MQRNAEKTATLPARGVDRFALKALSMVSGGGRVTTRPAANTPRPLFAEQLCRSVTSADPADVDEVLAVMRKAGVRDTEISDHYIPAVARQLGADWCDDILDFTRVSIGSARLQGLLRRLDPMWCTPHETVPTLGTALVVVPHGAQHMLGATIFAGQLRRGGANTVLELDTTASQLAACLEKLRPDALMISASPSESLETLQELVQVARETTAEMPIALGGSVLDHQEDICEMIGADHAMRDWTQALTLCRPRAAQ